MKRKTRMERPEDESPRRKLCPELPPIPASIINWKEVEWRKNEADIRNRYHWYAGPIEPGMIFAWEPDLPHARQLVIVVAITDPNPPEIIRHRQGTAVISGGTEQLIWSTTLDSPYRGKPFEWHAAPQLLEGHPIPNSEGRWREACIPTTMHPQTP